MKRLKDITKQIEKLAEEANIPEPIHFKDHNDELFNGEIPEPIDFKSIDEARKKSSYTKWLDTDENTHLHKIPKNASFGHKPPKWMNAKHQAISHNLSRQTALTPAHIHAIKSYSEDSRAMNRALLKGKGTAKTTTHKEIDRHLSNAIKSNPLAHNCTITSGLGFDPRKHHKKGILRSPCYISASHDKHVADGFAKSHDTKEGREQHIMHIHCKKGAHVLHIDHVSQHSGEYESIVHKGAKLKHIKTETHEHDDYEYVKRTHVHHYELQ